MRLPKERVLCSNLQTSFTDWPGLLAYLQEQAFDGYVALQRNGRYAWLFLALGNIVGGRHAIEDGVVAGDEAIEAFKKMAEAPGGTMDVYRAPRAQMQLLGAEVEPIYNDLPSDFVEMGKMVAALARARHDGYIEVSLRGSRGMGYVIFEDGEVMEALYSDETHSETGTDVLKTIEREVAARGADFRVFRRTARTRDVADAGMGTLNDDEAQELLAAWNAIFSAVEDVVDSEAEPGSFAQGLREAFAEHREAHPFLAESGIEGVYGPDGLRVGSAVSASMNDVLGQCLSEAVSRISFRFRKVDLESRIQAQLEEVAKAHAVAITRYGIARAASPYIAA